MKMVLKPIPIIVYPITHRYPFLCHRKFDKHKDPMKYKLIDPLLLVGQPLGSRVPTQEGSI